MAGAQKHQSMAEALLKPALVQPGPEDRDSEGGNASPVKMTRFMLVAFSSAMALGATVSFLVFSFLDLGMLFHCLRLYARTPPGSPRRELFKMAAWMLATMLTVTFFQLLEVWFMTVGKTETPIMDFFRNHAGRMA